MAARERRTPIYGRVSLSPGDTREYDFDFTTERYVTVVEIAERSGTDDVVAVVEFRQSGEGSTETLRVPADDGADDPANDATAAVGAATISGDAIQVPPSIPQGRFLTFFPATQGDLLRFRLEHTNNSGANNDAEIVYRAEAASTRTVALHGGDTA